MTELLVEKEEGLSEIALGIVHAKGCQAGPSPRALTEELDRAILHAKERNDTEEVRRAVREMLRYGRYKPTGRGKPASEYLFGAAREDRFPRLQNLVDINNLVSLETLLPCSILDLERAGTLRFRARRGREGEAYVFNPAGQTIDLRDLLLVARLPADEPCVNPIKDAMITKVNDQTREVMAVLYAPVSLREALANATARFARLLQEHAGAEIAREFVLQ